MKTGRSATDPYSSGILRSVLYRRFGTAYCSYRLYRNAGE